ncbi:MAG: pyruvate kinase, partial [Pseudomonadota bacterium]
MKPVCTKIVATVGPACESPEMIRRLIDAGADVFRLNFSHGTYEAHARSIATIRTAAEAVRSPIAILQDLQGPRIRTGMLKGHGPVELVQHSEVTLRAGDFEGDEKTIAVGYERFAADVMPGERILISDGLIELAVLSCDRTEARCRVVTGGRLGERKGINLPGSRLSISSPTEKDISDLCFGIEHGIDYVALSFVEKAADILRLKQEIHRRTGPDDAIPVIAKIERPRAVDCLHEILKVADGVM